MRRGFSLAEVLVTMMLMFVVLDLAAIMFKEYTSVLRHERGKERFRAAAQIALDGLKLELATALSVTSLGSDVQFTRINPSDTTRLPVLAPIPYPAASDPPWNPTTGQYTVRYWLSSETLYRSTSLSADPQPLLSGLNGFSVTDPNANRCYRISLSVNENRRVSALSTVCFSGLRR
jgi:type II secretory pathway component PulJ